MIRLNIFIIVPRVFVGRPIISDIYLVCGHQTVTFFFQEANTINPGFFPYVFIKNPLCFFFFGLSPLYIYILFFFFATEVHYISTTIF